jgi:hypothetical protein
MTYEDKITEGAEKKRDVDVVLAPTFKNLKTAFTYLFGSDNMNGSDFKRLSDFRYYQGGYPSPTTPPKESNIAFQVANVSKLEALLGKEDFDRYAQQYGVSVDCRLSIDDHWTLSKEDEKKLKDAWLGAGIDAEIPQERSEALKLLLDRSQNLQAEICEHSDFIKELAETVEEEFKIKKGNFMKAVGLAALRLRKGAGAMDEKLDDVVMGAENLILAVRPLLKSGD